MHAELINKYGSEWPSNETLRRYLTFERGFNESSVDDFISQFYETLEFAKIGKSGTIPPAAASLGANDLLKSIRTDGSGAKDAGMQIQDRSKQNLPPPPLPVGAVERMFTTGTDTMDAEIRITSHAGEITGDDIAFLKEYLSFLEKSWARRKPAVAAPVAAPEPVSAMKSGPPPPPSMSASMPIMVTKQQESDLRAAGYTQEQINAMTPQQAHENLAKRPT